MNLGLVERIDGAFYYINKLPAAVFNTLFKWSKYKTARFEAKLGYAALFTYLSSTAALLGSGDVEKLNSPEKIITLLFTIFIAAIYGNAIHKNLKEADVAEAREFALSEQNLDSVLGFENRLQRHRMLREAPLYAIGLPSWAGFAAVYASLVGLDISNRLLIAMVASATFTTHFVYGPRYVLTTGYSSIDEALSGGKKNAN